MAVGGSGRASPPIPPIPPRRIERAGGKRTEKKNHVNPSSQSPQTFDSTSTLQSRGRSEIAKRKLSAAISARSRSLSPSASGSLGSLTSITSRSSLPKLDDIYLESGSDAFDIASILKEEKALNLEHQIEKIQSQSAGLNIKEQEIIQAKRHLSACVLEVQAQVEITVFAKNAASQKLIQATQGSEAALLALIRIQKEAMLSPSQEATLKLAQAQAKLTQEDEKVKVLQSKLASIAEDHSLAELTLREHKVNLGIKQAELLRLKQQQGLLLASANYMQLAKEVLENKDSITAKQKLQKERLKIESAIASCQKQQEANKAILNKARLDLAAISQQASLSPSQRFAHKKAKVKAQETKALLEKLSIAETGLVRRLEMWQSIIRVLSTLDLFDIQQAPTFSAPLGDLAYSPLELETPKPSIKSKASMLHTGTSVISFEQTKEAELAKLNESILVQKTEIQALERELMKIIIDEGITSVYEAKAHLLKQKRAWLVDTEEEILLLRSELEAAPGDLASRSNLARIALKKIMKKIL